MDRLDRAAYLRRIGYHGPLEPTLATLRALHRAHMIAVPFENLDIREGRELALDEAGLFDKIVHRRRGGFCYELNGLFAALLSDLDFDVTLLAARVADERGGFGPEFDHLVLLVRLEDRWLADVGFGRSFPEPLRLDEPGEQAQDEGMYRIAYNEAQWIFLQRDDLGNWREQYAFTLQPRRLADFAAECRTKQASPFWTGRTICTRATPDGRITISDMKLIVTLRDERRELLLSGPEEYMATLREHFGIELPYNSP